MSREITSHQVAGNELNEAIRITVLDERGPGGANHEYRVDILHPQGGVASDSLIKFQKGPVGEAGANGISNEALLAIVIDRLEGFESGPFPCDDSANALASIKVGLASLRKRTIDRLARGVEGKSEA